jgi:hypothetical protein
MTYLIFVQDSDVMGTCFGDLKFWMHDGAISISSIDSQGTIREMHRGELVNGHFEVQDNS